MGTLSPTFILMGSQRGVGPLFTGDTKGVSPLEKLIYSGDKEKETHDSY